MLVLMLVPIVMVIGYSLMDRVIMTKESHFTGLANYVDVLTNPVFWVAVKNTTFFTGVSVVAHLVLGMGFALLLNSPLPAGNTTKAIFRVIYILPWLFTVAIIAVLWRLLLNPNGVVNYLMQNAGLVDDKVEWLASTATALYAVTFINIWSGYPFYMMSLLAGLQGIPRDLYEAAVVDGASGWQRFIHVTLPQLRPIIVSIAMLDVIFTTQQFALIWMTTGGGPINVTEMLSTFTYKLAFSKYDFATASASAVVIFGFSMVLVFFYVRYQKARTDMEPCMRRILLKTGVILALLVGAVVVAFPVVWMAASSFKTNPEIFELPPRLITENFSFDAYTTIVRDPVKVRFFINSYVVALSVTALTLVVAILAGYAFSRFDFVGKRPLNMIIGERAGGATDHTADPLLRAHGDAAALQHLRRTDPDVHGVHAALRDHHVDRVLQHPAA